MGNVVRESDRQRGLCNSREETQCEIIMRPAALSLLAMMKVSHRKIITDKENDTTVQNLENLGFFFSTSGQSGV